ncbi:hypothetical protein MSG28_005197 [Choristoneura fumiferana]|nr:hypothetical protein MSG28_005197 [Choristoneura fumiferana]
MAGVQRVRLNNLNINLKNAFIVGIIIAKNKPRIFGSKKRNGESRGVTSFTLRDSDVDTIYIDVWGSEYYVITFYERFLVGDVVEISSPKISVKGGSEMFKPLTSSPFELCLNEGMSDVAIHTGDSFTSFLPLLHIPSKPSAANNVYVDLLVVVKSVKPVKNIKTKAGVDMSVRSVDLSVLFIADARVSWRGRVAVQVCARSVVTHQPHTADAEALLLYAAQLKALSPDERAMIRWKVLLEQCNVKLAASPPRLLVLALRRASQADPIPLY